MESLRTADITSSEETPSVSFAAHDASSSQGARSTFFAAPRQRYNLRSTPWSEAVRSWITLIPLATALCGSLAIRELPLDQYLELLPPLFFVGALIVTAAMLHQRHLLRANLQLTEELQEMHERHDTLHHLSLELSTSLHVTQVAQTVLAHAMQFTNAGYGALWLRVESASANETRCTQSTGDAEDSSICVCVGDEGSTQWRLIAVEGVPESRYREQCGEWCKALRQGVSTLHVGDDFIRVPIDWKGAAEAVIFINGLTKPCSEDGRELLKNIALVAGPSLQNALLYQSASERAEIDGLTQLVNHRAIQERLNQEIARVLRARDTNPDVQFSIVTLDITDFKLFNDTYGHAVGDEVLRRVSGCLQHIFRASDSVGRFGGDEFLVLLPDTPFSGARTLCERVVQSITAEPFVATDGSPITIRLTCGIATYGEDGVTVVELLRAADARLYQAKRKGQSIIENTAEPATPSPPTFQPDWTAVGLLEALVATIDAKDHYTRSHCERVWRYALMIGHAMGFSRDLMEAVHLCSMVHDVGKIVIPDAILRKPGRLSEDEFEIMQRHTLFGAMIVRELPHLPAILGGVRHHHEHWDGSGYPDRLVADEIPLLGRVLAVADGFAAMTLQRPYRRALSPEQALLEVEAQKGVRYDPTVVNAFASVMRSSADANEALKEILTINEIAYLERFETPVAPTGNGYARDNNGDGHSPRSGVTLLTSSAK